MADFAVDLDTEFTIVDVDAHYVGRFEDLAEYIEPGPWRDRFSSAEVLAEGSNKRFWPKITDADYAFRSPQAEAGYAEGREAVIAIMEALSIDKILLLGNQMITFDQMKGDDARPTVYANAYVDYMLDQVVDPDDGIYVLAPIPHQDPEEAVQLIDRVGDERGVVGICIITSMMEPPAGNRRYDPIFAAAQDAGLPIVYHAGTPGVDSFPVAGYSRRIETHTLGFIWANTGQLASIVAQGVPEKFPELEFVFQEAGLFYLPMMMYRMDAEYMRKPNEAPMLTKRPSEYMQEFYYGTQPLEEVPTQRYYEYVIEMIGGPDRLMYSSDYPHPDYDTPRVITDMAFLDDDEKAAVLGGNAEAVFGI